MKKIIAFFAAFILLFSFTSCRDAEIELLESKSLVLAVGETGAFAEGFDYSTTDIDIIELSNNQYRTLKEGSAVVTVRQGENKVGVYIIAVYGTQTINLKDLTLVDQPSSLTIAQNVKLEYKKDPVNSNDYDAIIWESLNPEIATIDRYGNVTPLKVGEVTITLTAINTQVKKEFKFNVLPRATVFEINYSRIAGVEGNTEEILKTNIVTDYSFDGTVTWFSDDESVVTVDQEGTTTFVKPGTTFVGVKGIIDGKEVSYRTEVVVLEDLGYKVLRTPVDLQEIGNTSGNYMLGNDIDMKEAVSEGGELYNDGKGFMPLFENAKNSFKGVFDGNGFTIYNMYINRPNDVFVAFMRYISAEEGNEGIIKRLSFVGGEITGGNYTAVFYSNASGYGSVNSGLRDSYVNMKVKSVGSLSTLVGNNKGLVENCIVNVEYEAVGDMYPFALNHTGLEEGLGINNCVFIGDYQGTNYANLTNGGFVTNCSVITKDQIATHEFNMGNNWIWVKGSLPILKGVTYE